MGTLILILLLIITYFILRALARSHVKNDLLNQFRNVIRNHIKVLSRKKEQCTVLDDYGYLKFNEKKWISEVSYFVENVALREVNISRPKWFFNVKVELDVEFIRIIDKEIEQYEQQDKIINNLKKFDSQMDGYQYEHFCAEKLIDFGWVARVTQASGDQGADILGKFADSTAVFQCKKYNSLVGNKSVQEVYSAKSFYEADYAVVITNSSFTNSARILAKKLDVILIHHDDIDDLNSKLGLSFKNKFHTKISLNDDELRKALLNKFYKSYKDGDLRTALSVIDRLIKKNTQESKYYYYRAIVNKKINSYDLALSDIKKAASLGHEKAIKILRKK